MVFSILCEGMEGQVQQFVTVRFGDLWVDVSLAPLANSVSESWKTAAASPTQAKREEEATSAAGDGFIPVMSKSAKRKMRRKMMAARKNVAQNLAKGVATHVRATSDPVSDMKRNFAEAGQSSRQHPKHKGK